MSNPENTEKKREILPEWRKPDGRFAPGNQAAKNKGRHKATKMAEALIDGAAERVVQALIQKAEGGDCGALKLVMDRLAPPRKSAPFIFDLPAIDGIESARQALADIIAAQASGELTADEADGLASTVEKYIKVAQVADLEARVDRLEIVRTVIDVTRATNPS